MTIINYERKKAVQYAVQWATSRNPEYYDYSNIGGDCTNFASQCVYAGTGIMNYNELSGWYYINANNKSPSWTGVEFFYDFMTKNESIGPFGEETNLSEILPGDIIQLQNSSGDFYHTLVLTNIVNFFGKQYLVSSHSQDSLRRNLFSYNFYDLRCIHILGARMEDE